MPPVKFASSMQKAKKTYLVGLDGSALSMRAVLLASQMIDQYNDNLVLFTLGRKEGDKAEIFDRTWTRRTDPAAH